MPDRTRRKSRRSDPAVPTWVAVLLVLVVGAAGFGVMGVALVRAFQRVPAPEADASAVAAPAPAPARTPASVPAVNPVVPTRSTPPPPAPPAGPPTLAPVVRFTTGIPKVGRLTLSANGRRLLALTAYNDPGIQAEVWEVSPAPRLLRRFEALRAMLSPDGRRLLAPRELIRWDLVDLDTGATAQLPRLPGIPLGFSGPDRLVLTDATKRGRLAVTQVDTRNWAAVGPGFVVPTESDSTTNDLMNDSRHLVVVEPNQPKFSAWDVTTGARVGGALLPGVRGGGGSRQVVLSPDATRVAAAKDKTLRAALFDAATGRELAEYDWAFGVLQFVPGRDLLLTHLSGTGGRNGLPGWRAFAPGRREGVADLAGAHYHAGVSADGRVLAAAAAPHGAEVVVYDLTRIP